MGPTYDVIVVGLGAAGSAAAYHLARRGCRVLGLDRFAPPHAQGSSHGESRIIRRAYFEGARYLPLLDRAYALWRELEAGSGRSLLRVTGGLTIGAADEGAVRGAQETARAYAVPHELLDARAIRVRFPAFHLPKDHVALWEPGAGLLYPERCIEAHLEGARGRGADLHLGEPTASWQADGDGVAVATERATYRAERLVLCAGGWTGDLLPELHLPLRIERQVNLWFRPRDAEAELLRPERCPVYIWAFEPDRLLYGFPDLGEGVKAGLHHRGERTSHPNALRREVTQKDEAALRGPLARLLPGAVGPLLRAQTCFYTNTPDEDYLIDRHPEHPQVVFATACSGHGFKASNAVGEALADLTLERTPRIDLAPFRLGRAGLGPLRSPDDREENRG